MYNSDQDLQNISEIRMPISQSTHLFLVHMRMRTSSIITSPILPPTADKINNTARRRQPQKSNANTLPRCKSWAGVRQKYVRNNNTINISKSNLPRTSYQPFKMTAEVDVEPTYDYWHCGICPWCCEEEGAIVDRGLEIWDRKDYEADHCD